MTDHSLDPEEVRLPFQPGDRFVQVHRNRAILVVADDYQWELATAGQAVAVAQGAAERGTRILLGHEVLDDETTAVLEVVRNTGAEVVDFGTVIPPMTWPNGTTPLMTAATLGRNDLLSDLLTRGSPPGATDIAGGTALHRTAHAGNEDGCDALLAAGADPAARDNDGRTPADLAWAAGHYQLALRLDPATPTAPAPPANAATGDVRLPRGAPIGFLYELLGVVTTVVLAVLVALRWRNDGSLLLLTMPLLVGWQYRYLLWAGAPLRIRDGALRLLALRGVVSVPLHEVRGVLVAPAHGLGGTSWRVVLCQDAVGRRSSPSRLRAVDHAFVSAEDAERFAGLAGRHQVVILGRGSSTDVVLAALRPRLDRPDVVGNRWWHELGRYSAWDVMTDRLHHR